MFFQIQIRHVLVYGYIYDNGMFEINMWDFDADDYWFRDGRKKSVKAAWHMIYHMARNMDRFNHFIDEDGVKETEAALDLFLEDFLEELDKVNLEEQEKILFENWELEQAKTYSFLSLCKLDSTYSLIYKHLT